ncbi:MAG: sigma-70 family RNA polymerase sigma factor [Bacillota bacterium]
MINYKNIIELPECEVLAEKEIRRLLERAQKGDEGACDRVVKHNLKLVLKVVYRFKNCGYELEDLFQIGVIGLMKAVSGFDLKRNVRFSTYAFAKILGEIRLFLRDEGSIKASRSLKKIGRIVRNQEEELTQKLNKRPTLEELSAATGFSREQIVQALELRQEPASLFEEIGDSKGKELYLMDNLSADRDNFNRLELMEALRELDERSRQIVFLRYFQDKTQAEIGEVLGISQVQVSRLEKKILEKLRYIL